MMVDTTETCSVAVLFIKPTHCLRWLNRYIMEYTQQDAKCENEENMAFVYNRR
jgi:hypothetical protein